MTIAKCFKINGAHENQGGSPTSYWGQVRVPSGLQNEVQSIMNKYGTKRKYKTSEIGFEGEIHVWLFEWVKGEPNPLKDIRKELIALGYEWIKS